MNENKNETCAVNPEALRALVARCRERRADPRMGPLLAMLAVTGRRASEVRDVTRADVDGERLGGQEGEQ